MVTNNRLCAFLAVLPLAACGEPAMSPAGPEDGDRFSAVSSCGGDGSNPEVVMTTSEACGDTLSGILAYGAPAECYHRAFHSAEQGSSDVASVSGPEGSGLPTCKVLEGDTLSIFCPLKDDADSFCSITLTKK